MRRILMLVVGIVLLACSPKTGVEVQDAWARPALQGENGAIYFVVQNHTAESQEITGVSSDVAQAVEMHESQMSGDLMQMHQVHSVSLGPRAEVIFAPGGLHIMLVDLKQELEIGDEVEITLQFSNFDDIKVLVPVRDTSAGEQDH